MRARPRPRAGTWAVTAVPTVREAVSGADVVVTCTAARAPLARGVLDRRRARTSRPSGRTAAGKQELDPAILRRADVLVVDSLEQCARLGELQHAPEQAERAVELGAVCAGRAPGRTDEDQLTVCDLTGVGVQDVAAANAVLAAAAGCGETIE